MLFYRRSRVLSRPFPQKVERSGPASHDSRLSRRHHHQHRHTSSQGGIIYIQTDTLGDDILSDQIDVLGTGIEKEKDEEEEEEHPDLLACRRCELVLAHAWGLKDHQIRGRPVDEPPTKRCEREDDEVEGTYGYKLECYLKDLPATVYCTEQLPRPSREPILEFRRQHGLLRSRRDTLGGISFPKRRTSRIFRFVRTSIGNVSASLQKRADRQRTAIQVQHSSSSTEGRRHLWTLLRSLRQIQI